MQQSHFLEDRGISKWLPSCPYRAKVANELLTTPYKSETVGSEQSPFVETGTTFRRNCSGFSLIELVIVVAIILIVSAIAVPAFVRMTNSSELTTTTRGVSDLIQRARSEAVKQNTKVSCHFDLGAAPPVVWVDVNRSGVRAANDPQAYYPGPVRFAASGGWIPGPASMNFPSTTPVAAGGVITFDSRGAVDFTAVGGVPTAWVLYLNFSGDPSYGAKGISVEPLGRSKIWSATSGAAAWTSQ
jgi:prepilin-type N-terminal cleavage/methylation domain-containing protein